MKKLLLIIIALVLFVPSMASAETKIGVVNMLTLRDKSEPGEQAMKKLEAQFKDLKSQLEEQHKEILDLKQELEKQSLALSQEAKMDKEVQLQKRMNDFRVNEQSYKRKIAQEKDGLMRDLLQLFFQVVDDYGKKNGYSLIVDRVGTGIVYMDAGQDITNDVLVEVNKAWRAKQKK